MKHTEIMRFGNIVIRVKGNDLGKAVVPTLD